MIILNQQKFCSDPRHDKTSSSVNGFAITMVACSCSDEQPLCPQLCKGNLVCLHTSTRGSTFGSRKEREEGNHVKE